MKKWHKEPLLDNLKIKEENEKGIKLCGTSIT